MTFLIITPVYNAEDWVEKCIDSVLAQTYPHFKQVIIDDGSSDSTFKLIEQKTKNDKRFYRIKKDARYGAMHSHIIGTNFIAKEAGNEDVIIHLDGDDWFSSEDVLQKLSEVYENTKCWVTYGSYEATDPRFPRVCKDFDRSLSFRKQAMRQWTFSHLRTFKKFLWDKMQLSNFTDSNNKLVTTACDVAIFLPMLEMAGHERVEFIEDTLLIYNRSTPNNDDKLDIRDQHRCAWEVLQKNEVEVL